MSEIHSTAILEGDVDLDDEVEIGPYCVLQGRIRLGKGTRLLSHVQLQGPLEIGAGNILYPGCSFGFAPQSIGHDIRVEGKGLVIGKQGTFREGVTLSRALTDNGPTRVGDHAFFMANSHAGHDCQVGDHVVLANGALLAGHVEVGDRVFVGGNACVHQFCRIGRGSMISGAMAMNRDLPPFFMLTGMNVAGSINLIGLRRSGMPAEDIGDVRWVFKTMYRRGLARDEVAEALEERLHRPLVAEFLRFLRESERGMVHGAPEAKRGANT